MGTIFLTRIPDLQDIHFYKSLLQKLQTKNASARALTRAHEELLHLYSIQNPWQSCWSVRHAKVQQREGNTDLIVDQMIEH